MIHILVLPILTKLFVFFDLRYFCEDIIRHKYDTRRLFIELNIRIGSSLVLRTLVHTPES